MQIWQKHTGALPVAAAIGLLAGAACAQNGSSPGVSSSASSIGIERPNNATPSYPLGETGVYGADSNRTATITNWTPSIATVSRPGPDCPQGWVWGAPYGVSNCLRPVDKCEAAYLTWIVGDAICQGFAPATAAFFYMPKRYYRGSLVDVCPAGSSKRDCTESYVREDSPPISVMTSTAISQSIGAAAAACNQGRWEIKYQTCHLPTAPGQGQGQSGGTS